MRGGGLCNLILFSGSDWQAFGAGDNSFALVFCMYLLRGKVTLSTRGIPWNSWKVQSER